MGDFIPPPDAGGDDDNPFADPPPTETQTADFDVPIFTAPDPLTGPDIPTVDPVTLDLTTPTTTTTTTTSDDPDAPPVVEETVSSDPESDAVITDGLVATSGVDNMVGDGDDTTFIFDQAQDGGTLVSADAGGAFVSTYPGNLFSFVQTETEGRTSSGEDDSQATAQSLGSISGTVSGANVTVFGWIDATNPQDHDFYNFTLDVTTTLYFDIDYANDVNGTDDYDTGLDSMLAVYDASGTLRAYNDDYSYDDPGSAPYGYYDPFIGGLSLSAGTYTAVVTSYGNRPDNVYDESYNSLSINGYEVIGASPGVSIDDGDGWTTGQYLLQVRNDADDIAVSNGIVQHVDTVTDTGGEDSVAFQNLEGVSIKLSALNDDTVQAQVLELSYNAEFEIDFDGERGFDEDDFDDDDIEGEDHFGDPSYFFDTDFFEDDLPITNTVNIDTSIEIVEAATGAVSVGSVELVNAMSLGEGDTAYVVAGGNSGDTLTIDDNDTVSSVIFGNGGNDWMQGSDGNDIFNGGSGIDYHIGQGGSDVFLYTSVTDSASDSSSADLSDPRFEDIFLSEEEIPLYDWIEDFDALDGDEVIWLDGIIASTSTFTYIGDSAFSSTLGNAQARYDSDTQLLEIDINGSGNSEMTITLTGEDLGALDTSDFLVT